MIKTYDELRKSMPWLLSLDDTDHKPYTITDADDTLWVRYPDGLYHREQS